MDGFPHPLLDAPLRDPRYAARRLEVERRGDGSFVLSNPTPFSRAHLTTNGALDRWAGEAPDRVWLAERTSPSSPSGLTRAPPSAAANLPDGAVRLTQALGSSPRATKREGAGSWEEGTADGWRTVSYVDAHRTVAELAGGLLALGLGPDAPLLILARNGVDHALVAYAAMRIGSPIAPVSPQYGLSGANPERLAHAVALVRPRAVFVDDWGAFAHAVEDCAGLDGLPVIAARGASGRATPLDAVRGEPTSDLARPEQAAKLLLTSGSTGRPKAVVCRHRNVSLNAAQIAACFDDPDPPVVVNAAPWSHSLGANAILHMVLHRGGTLYIDHGQPTARGFGETLRNLAEIAPTYHNMVPAGWALFADALERDEGLATTFFSRVRVLQYGGASMPQSVCDRVEAVAARVTGERITFATGFGSTETGPTACNIHWPNVRVGQIGLPTPGTSLKLAPAFEAGEGKYEARVKGPQISPGYRAPDGSLLPLDLDEEGFYRLGDAARFVDPGEPGAGLMFDGRLVENFKLASGTFVAAGHLRVAALSAIGGAVTDAVVCGEGRDGVGLLLFPSPNFAGDHAQAVSEGLARLNASAGGAAGRVARALLLDSAPDAHSGELTDKGYLNQSLARTRRTAEVERLFAVEPDEKVIRL